MEFQEAVNALKNAVDANTAQEKERIVGPVGPRGPSGSQGIPGEAASIEIGSTVSVPPDAPARVTNSGSSPQHVILNFEIPKGSVGERGPAGRDSTVPGPKGDSGRNGADSTVPGPRGLPGLASSIAIGKTETLPAGEQASVKNVGTENAVVLEFKLPVGAEGAAGRDGIGKDGRDGLTEEEIKNIVRATIIETMQNVGVMTEQAAKLVAIRVALKKAIHEADSRHQEQVSTIIKRVNAVLD